MTARDDEQRLARLAEEELTALVARFEQSGLGELEVRREDWTIRLRRSEARGGLRAERSTRRGRGQTAHEASVSPPAGATVPRDPAAPGFSTAGDGAHGGAHPSVLAAVGPGRGAEAGQSRRRAATSPAVGYFAPLDDLASGHQVQAGDLLGYVDVLGVRQEVVAPMDGIVVRVVVQPGQAVEYGEELVRVDAMRRSTEAAASAEVPGPAASEAAEALEAPEAPEAPDASTSAPAITPAPEAPSVPQSGPAAELSAPGLDGSGQAPSQKVEG